MCLFFIHILQLYFLKNVCWCETFKKNIRAQTLLDTIIDFQSVSNTTDEFANIGCLIFKFVCTDRRFCAYILTSNHVFVKVELQPTAWKLSKWDLIAQHFLFFYFKK